MFESYEEWKLLSEKISSIIKEIVQSVNEIEKKQIEKYEKKLSELNKKIERCFKKNKKVNDIIWQVKHFISDIIKTINSLNKNIPYIHQLQSLEKKLSFKQNSPLINLPKDLLQSLIDKLLSLEDTKSLFQTCSFFSIKFDHKKVLEKKILTALEIKCGNYHNVIRLNNYYYGWGNNNSGQLGLDVKNQTVPQRINFKKKGKMNDFMLGPNATVFSSNNTHFIFGKFEKCNNSFFSSQKLKSFDIFANDYFGFILTTKGECYVFGRNDMNQLGLENNDSIVKMKKLDLQFLGRKDRIKKIAIGEAHTLFLTEERNIFVCGANKLGQCGFQNDEKIKKPTELNITIKKNDIHITAGWNHSIIWDKEHIFVMGSNKYGQLGTGDNCNRDQPTELNLNFMNLSPENKISRVMAKSNHTIILMQKGDCYVCGQNNCGQLGLGNNQNCNIPTKIEPAQFNLDSNDKIEDIILGMWHTIFISEKRRIFIVGDNSFGQIGSGKSEMQFKMYELTFHFDLIKESLKETPKAKIENKFQKNAM